MATVRLQLRRGVAQDWFNANPTLAAGEIGIETDTSTFKFGDGNTAWRDLDYALSGTVDDYIPLTQKAVAGGIASLDSSGFVPASQLPPLAKVTVSAVANQAARLALTAEAGDIAIQADNGQSYVLASSPASTDGNWRALVGSEAVVDTVESALIAGTGLDKTYNDASGTITIDIDSTVATKTYADQAVSAEAVFRVSGDSGSVSTAAADATTKANAAQSAAEATAASALSTHSADTTNVHGIEDTSILVTTTGTQTLLSKSLTSPQMTGVPVAPTATAGTDTTQVATTAFVQDAIELVVGAAPAALNTLAEIATSLANNGDLSGTLTTSISGKVAKSGDTMSGILDMGSNKITSLSTPTANSDASTKAYVDSEITRVGSGILQEHNAVTTNVHGITNTANLVYTNDARLTDSRNPIDNSVATASLQNDSVTSDKIADLAVGSAQIVDLTVTSIKIADLAVTTAKIADSAITAGKIDNSAVTNSKLAENAVTEGKISGASVTTSKIADLAVTTAKIADSNITTAKINNDAVTADKIGSLAVTEGKIADLAVTTAKIADSAITTGKIAAGAVETADLADGAVTSAKIAANAISQSHMSDDSVGTNEIGGLAVTTAKIADGAVTTAKIADGAVTKTMVGLANVDNTSDASKPVSTATQTALNAKANLAAPTFTGTVSGITKSMVGLDSVDNTADSAKPVSTAAQTALNLKANLAGPTFTGTVSGITKSMVGLGSVDNTADSAKPVSTAAQTALDAKLNLAGGTMTGALTLSGAPTSDLHAATKLYVDNVTAGINFHEAVHAGSISSLNANYANGTSGVGATLTADTNRAFSTLDGETVAVGQRVLIKNQTDAKQNGIYTLTTVGSVSAPWVLTRATDADNNPTGEMKTGDFVFVINGTVNASVGYINNSTANPIVIGTDNISYTEFSAGKTVVAGSGLTEATPGTLSIATGAITSDMIANGSIVDADVNASAAIAKTKISGTAITAADTGTVTSTMILDGTIATGDIADGAITTAKIADGAIVTVDLADGAVTSAKIADGTIVDADINASAAIAQSKIANLTTDLAAKAPLANPTFTGTVTVAASGVAFTDKTQTRAGVPSLTTIATAVSSSTTLDALGTDAGVRDSLVPLSGAVGITFEATGNAKYAIGSSISFYQSSGTGANFIESGITVLATPGRILRTTNSSVTATKIAATTWLLAGDLR